MKLSIVMPHYNRPDALPRTLRALARQTLPLDEFEVIVVEDANNSAPIEPGPPELDLRILKGSRPGASEARNVGWRAARAPVVLFLGDDITPARDTLERHAAWHEREPGVDVGVLGHVRWARGLKRTAFVKWLDYGIQFDYRSIRGTTAGPGHFYTANVSCKTAVLDEVGGFDAETFPFLYEDIDLGLRLFARPGGYRLIYDRKATADHHHQPELEQWQRRMVVQAQAEKAWIKRHPDQKPYFRDLFADAVRGPELRGRRGRALMRIVPRGTPVLGKWIWDNADLYFKQQLGRPFMEAWERSE